MVVASEGTWTGSRQPQEGVETDHLKQVRDPKSSLHWESRLELEVGCWGIVSHR